MDNIQIYSWCKQLQIYIDMWTIYIASEVSCMHTHATCECVYQCDMSLEGLKTCMVIIMSSLDVCYNVYVQYIVWSLDPTFLMACGKEELGLADRLGYS